eukprot:229458-Pelagomonas_calceolata.AAC.2
MACTHWTDLARDTVCCCPVQQRCKGRLRVCLALVEGLQESLSPGVSGSNSMGVRCSEKESVLRVSTNFEAQIGAELHKRS